MKKFIMLAFFLYGMFIFKVVCISPTYELAIQTGEVASKMAQYCPEIQLKYAVQGEEGKILHNLNLIML